VVLDWLFFDPSMVLFGVCYDTVLVMVREDECYCSLSFVALLGAKGEAKKRGRTGTIMRGAPQVQQRRQRETESDRCKGNRKNVVIEIGAFECKVIAVERTFERT
jgi:hypothetical protein